MVLPIYDRINHVRTCRAVYPLSKRIPIYPRTVKETRFPQSKICRPGTRLRSLLSVARWWERPNTAQQAVLFDIPNRHFCVFDLAIEAQDIIWLGGLLVIAAMLLFFVTGIAGRVFCGYFCFQTCGPMCSF
ncbi:MAG: hypothetical protein R3F37_13880 [Candidatus Competibacteraceae bacterium]